MDIAAGRVLDLHAEGTALTADGEGRKSRTAPVAENATERGSENGRSEEAQPKAPAGCRPEDARALRVPTVPISG